MANGDDQGEMEPLSSESVLACVKRRRDRLLKEARNSGPLFGYGRVAHLVKAFERLLSIEYRGLGSQGRERIKREQRGGNEMGTSWITATQGFL